MSIIKLEGTKRGDGLRIFSIRFCCVICMLMMMHTLSGCDLANTDKNSQASMPPMSDAYQLPETYHTDQREYDLQELQEMQLAENLKKTIESILTDVHDVTIEQKENNTLAICIFLSEQGQISKDQISAFENLALDMYPSLSNVEITIEKE